jgi:hypothetical protein
VLDALIAEAEKGKTQAAKLLLDYVRVVQGEPEAEEGMSWESMTPAQRAAARAQIFRELESIEADPPAQSAIGGE